MSVYIKGMEMPKDGVYWCEIGVTGEIAMITIHGEDRKSFPLIPVPDHGRLIDADALLATERETFEDYHISEAPTIIPADEEIK